MRKLAQSSWVLSNMAAHALSFEVQQLPMKGPHAMDKEGALHFTES